MSGVVLPCLGWCSHVWGGAPMYGVVLPCLGWCSHVWGGAPMSGVVLPCMGWCSHVWGGAPMYGVVLPCMGWCSHVWGGAPMYGVVLPCLGWCSHVWGGAPMYGVVLPCLGWCSHVWGGAPKSSLHLLAKIPSKAVRFINNPNLTNSSQSLSHRRLVADLSNFYPYFHGHCSLEIKNIIPDPVRRVQTTRSSTHSHLFQVTLPNPQTLPHKSSFIPRSSQLWNSLPSTIFPESYNLSSFKSNINKLDLVSLYT